MTSTTEGVSLPALAELSTLHQAYLGFLARYSGETRKIYEYHLGAWLRWCAERGVDPMKAKRAHLELYVRWRNEERGNMPSSIHTAMTPVKGLYKFADIDGLIDKDPSAYIRLPKIYHTRKSALDRHELARMLMVAKETSPRHWALIELLSVMALRISEALSITEASFASIEHGHTVLAFVGKGGRPARMPVPAPVLRSLEAAAAANPGGTLVPACTGRRLSRSGGAGLVRTVARRAGVTRPVNPHLLRASVITQAFDAGLPTRDVQHLARHEDPRTTSRHYDLGRDNLDRHAVHILAARLAA